MYSIGDQIIYGGEGVCTVEAIGSAPISGLDSTRTYYTLSPVYRCGTIYAPTDVGVRMRLILTRSEALELIRSIPGMGDEYTKPSDIKQAVNEYRSYLMTYDCENLIHLIRMIHHKNREAISAGRGFGQTDDRFMKRAKELLYGELALSLGIPVDEVEGVITSEIEAQA